jgi:hypothetical protein
MVKYFPLLNWRVDKTKDMLKVVVQWRIAYPEDKRIRRADPTRSALG